MKSGHLLIRGDARDLSFLPDRCVHCVVCSPPYFNLRSYDTATWEGGDPACDHMESKPSRTEASVRSSGLDGGKGNIHRSHVYRDLCGRCGARRVDRQIGLEASVGDYVAALVAVGRQLRRVMRDDATWWLNLGDSFNSSPPGNKRPMSKSNLNGAQTSASYRARLEETQQRQQEGRRLQAGFKSKDLMMVPARVAIALQEAGWYLRQEITWIKTCPMPESVRDRPTSATEKIYLFSKGVRYYYDRFACLAPSAAATLDRDQYSRITAGKDGPYSVQHDHETPSDPAGRNLWNWWQSKGEGSDVGGDDDICDDTDDADGPDLPPTAAWKLGPDPFKGAHFAVYPREIPRRAILLGSSEKGVCPTCGGPWVRSVVLSGKVEAGHRRGDNAAYCEGRKVNGASILKSIVQDERWGPSCSCPVAEPHPAVILDPFAGSSTTGVAAHALGRHYIGIDLSADYLALSARRLRRPHAPLPRPVGMRPAAAAAAADDHPLFPRSED